MFVYIWQFTYCQYGQSIAAIIRACMFDGGVIVKLPPNNLFWQSDLLLIRSCPPLQLPTTIGDSHFD